MDIFTITTQEILDRVSRHCPDALSAYLQCLNRCNSKRSVFFSKDLVEVDMSEQWHPFKNKIKKLARENLLEWHPLDGGIAVTLMGFDDE
jgi:hypothetical protein